MNARIALFAVFWSLVPGTGAMAMPAEWLQRCETPFTLRTGAGLDSNPLRLASPSVPQNGVSPTPGEETPASGSPGQTDASALVRPSLSLRCAVTSKTSLSGTYSLGLERFRSTALLNTTTHLGEIRLLHRFPGRWTGEMAGQIEKSNQPDVIASQPARGFGTFTEDRGGLRVSKTDARGTTFSEYFAQRRRYGRLVAGSTAHQADMEHSFTLGRWQRLSNHSFLGLRLDYLQNQSNDPAFRYREPYASLSYMHLFRSGFRADVTPRVRRIDFASRPVSGNPARTRSDVIAGLSVGVRKEFLPGISASVSYSFDRDSSTDPIRRFNDHRVWTGLDIRVGSRARRSGSSGDDPSAAAETANLGYAQIQRGNWHEALRLSLEAIRLDPEIAEAHTNAGIAYYELGNRAAAIAEWKTSLALQPNEKVQNLLKKLLATP